jgi:hypothetical protein
VGGKIVALETRVAYTHACAAELHASIEVFLESGTIPVSPLPEFAQFLDYLHTLVVDGYSVFRTEMVLYTPDRRLAGSVDLVLVDADGRYFVVDWKRKATVWSSAFNGSVGEPPLDGLPASGLLLMPLMMPDGACPSVRLSVCMSVGRSVCLSVLLLLLSHCQRFHHQRSCSSAAAV